VSRVLAYIKISKEIIENLTEILFIVHQGEGDDSSQRG
jgi:hypothetical protein